MVNILAQKPVVKELVQFDFMPDKVIDEIERLLVPENRDALLEEMKQASDKLGQGGAAEHAAPGCLPPVKGIIVPFFLKFF